jgi:hypothetical protein
MTSQDATWELGSWIVEHKENDILCRLVNANAEFIETTAQDIYNEMTSDKDFVKLIGCFSERRHHPSMHFAKDDKIAAVHLSGLRAVLKLIGAAYANHPTLPKRQRLDAYRKQIQKPVRGERRLVLVPALAKGAVA